MTPPGTIEKTKKVNVALPHAEKTGIPANLRMSGGHDFAKMDNEPYSAVYEETSPMTLRSARSPRFLFDEDAQLSFHRLSDNIRTLTDQLRGFQLFRRPSALPPVWQHEHGGGLAGVNVLAAARRP
jgi:hypothetical protein